MTKQGALNDLSNLINSSDIPMYYKPSLKKIKETIELEMQPKMGEWIEVEVCNCHATLKCSVCDRVIEPTFTYGEYSYDDIKEWYPYCHCGCRMNGGGEG